MVLWHSYDGLGLAGADQQEDVMDEQVEPEPEPVERITVELYEEGDHWWFHIPALHILGGGCATRDEAICHCADAMRFGLDCPPPEGS